MELIRAFHRSLAAEQEGNEVDMHYKMVKLRVYPSTNSSHDTEQIAITVADTGSLKLLPDNSAVKFRKSLQSQ